MSMVWTTRPAGIDGVSTSFKQTKVKTPRFKRKEKTEVICFQDFMRKKDQALSVSSFTQSVKKPMLSTLPLVLAPIWAGTKAFAQEVVQVAAEPNMQAKIMTAFAPILDLVQSLAYPVALIVVLGGGLFVMVGNTEKGFSLIQRAGLGYVLIMMLPMLLDVLVDAMSSVV